MNNNLFRSQLADKKRELLHSLGFRRFDTLARQGRVAEDDQAVLEHEEFISLQRNSLAYDTMRQVDFAMERLELGEFGVCASCDEPIPERRLHAIPWAKYCVPCQERIASESSGAGRFEHEDEFDLALA